jgi:hypothetical protein
MANDRRKILSAINREARKIKDPTARRKFKRAAVQTGIVESGLKNLTGGDADSAGWRQERASLYANPTNIKASARRFRQEFQQHYDPGEASYEVAAQVQRPAAQYRGRYKDVAAQADRIVQSELGGGAPNVREGSGQAGAGVSRYRTVQGVDRSADRQALRVNYLSERGKPGALLALGEGLNAAVDTPDRQVKVKGSEPRQPSTPGQGKKPGKGATDIREIIGLAKSYGLHVSENPLVDKVDPVHTAGSYHYRKAKGAPGAAADVSGDPAAMRKFARVLARRYGRDLEELIWRGPGARTIKKGRKVPKNFYSAHTDHVHVADTD